MKTFAIKTLTILITIMLELTMTGCAEKEPAKKTENPFEKDVQFLKKHAETLVLSDSTGQSRIAVVPDYQGRVMTSTAGGENPQSFGWINYELIEEGKTLQHINPWGGEDRFWLGPEGGQYSLFFEPKTPYTLQYWQTPPVIDTEAYELVASNTNTASFTKPARLINRAGTRFDVLIERTLSVLERQQAETKLQTDVPDSVRLICFQSENRLTNKGLPWRKQRGLLSIWILGMFKSSPATTVVIPFEKGAVDQLGPKVNDEYFGKVPKERLAVKQDVLFFEADGKFRSKIGVGPKRAKTIAGSYDAKNNTLTIIQYSKPRGAADYVNSLWKDQEKPYAGDVLNAYNDGPPEDSQKQLGLFYELESSSPAKQLNRDESISHTHRTFHLQGKKEQLDEIAQQILGVTLDEIQNAL